MYITSRKRSGRSDNLMVFNFRSIEEDFEPFIDGLEQCSQKFKDNKCSKLWMDIVNKIKNRCDSKYAHDDIVVSSTLFADEYAEFMQLASWLLINHDKYDVSSKLPFSCPICQREGHIILTDKGNKVKYFCALCGFERTEITNEISKSEPIISIGAGAIILKHYKENNNVICSMHQVPRRSSIYDVNRMITQMQSEFNVSEFFATWFDEETLEIKIIAP